nr:MULTISPECIES: type II toxin-antitoxin system VapC family toxin [unclassified Frankia]
MIIHMPVLTQGQLPREGLISAITLAELTAGPHVAKDPVERATRVGRLRRTEAAFDTLPFDVSAARQYGPVDAAVRAVNRDPRGRLADLLIACVAIAHQLPLFTVNPKDFAGLERMLEVVPVSHP